MTNTVRRDTTDNTGRVVTTDIATDSGYLTMSAAPGDHLTPVPVDLEGLLTKMTDAGVDRQDFHRIGPFGVVISRGRDLAWIARADRTHISIGGGRLGVSVRWMPRRAAA